MGSPKDLFNTALLSSRSLNGLVVVGLILFHATKATDPLDNVCGYHFPLEHANAHVIARTAPGANLTAFTINYYVYFEAKEGTSYILSTFFDSVKGERKSRLIAWFTDDATITLNKWIQITQTWTASTGRIVIYVDGNEANVRFTGWKNALAPQEFIMLGQHLTESADDGACGEKVIDNSERFIGYITHLQFWDHVLEDDHLKVVLSGKSSWNETLGIPRDTVFDKPMEVKSGAESFYHGCDQCPDFPERTICWDLDWGYDYWGYYEDNPNQWPGLCQTGTKQSPINIPEGTASNIVDGGFESLNFTAWNRTLDDYDIANNQYTILIRSNTLSNLEDDVYIRGVAYKFDEMRFHWKSEHTIIRRQYPLEMQVQMKETNDPDKKAILSVLFYLKDDDDLTNKWLEQLEPQVIIVQQPIVLMGGWLGKTSLDMSHLVHLIMSHPSIYCYEGSLTHPPCTEGIKYYIFEDLDTVLTVKQHVEWLKVLRCDPFSDYASDPTMMGNKRRGRDDPNRPIELIQITNYVEH